MSKSVVHIEDICFSYESEMILKHLSMDVSSSRIFFIMGNNGSGKTTLLNNLMGFLLPQQGVIQLSGNDISSLDRQTMSRLVAYVPQAIHLNTDFSVVDYIALGRTPHIGMFNRLTDEDYQVIEKVSILLGVDSIFEASFNKLSGGQKQMVAIARSLVQDAPIIILDEPMSALDIGKQVELLKVLQNLAESGKTVILTTHNPNHALTVDSDACFMKQGELVAVGKSKEIITENLLRSVYGDNITLDHGRISDSVVFKPEGLW